MTLADRLLKGGGKKRTPKIAKTPGQEAQSASLQRSFAIISRSSRAAAASTRNGRIKILFEKHKFYAHTFGEGRDAAEKAGLARKKWISPANGGYRDQPNNPAALKLLTKAMAIDAAAALKSASYGAGQIMGENYKLCGWETVEDFVSDMVESEDAQIQAMFGFLKGRSLVDEMQAKDFAAIARAYNGPGQVDAYAARMRAAYKKQAGKEPKVESLVRQTGLRMGSNGYRVNALQERLNKLGYAVQVDGDFGDATRRAVVAFQVDHDLKPDGMVGPGTEEALDNASSIISDERAGATMQDLRERNSTIVKSGDTTQAVGLLGAAAWRRSAASPSRASSRNPGYGRLILDAQPARRADDHGAQHRGAQLVDPGRRCWRRHLVPGPQDQEGAA